jgi:hypothetical protein
MSLLTGCTEKSPHLYDILSQVSESQFHHEKTSDKFICATSYTLPDTLEKSKVLKDDTLRCCPTQGEAKKTQVDTTREPGLEPGVEKGQWKKGGPSDYSLQFRYQRGTNIHLLLLTTASLCKMLT